MRQLPRRLIATRLPASITASHLHEVGAAQGRHCDHSCRTIPWDPTEEPTASRPQSGYRCFPPPCSSWTLQIYATPAAPWPGAFPCHLLQSEKQSKTPSFFSLAPLHSPPLKGERATASESPSSNGRARRQGPRRTLCRPLCRPVRAGRMATHQST